MPPRAAKASGMSERLPNRGLGGDGDEIGAITHVEQAFGVTLDYSDAGNWSTVGDVYAALLRELSAEEAARPDVWERFAKAISYEIGINPANVGLETGMLAEDGIWIHTVKFTALHWIVAALFGFAILHWAFG